MTPQSETPRLYLAPFRPDGVYTYYRDVALPAAERGDAWHWTLRLKTDPGRLIGCIGLMKGEEINRGFGWACRGTGKV